MKPTDTSNPEYFHKVVDCQWGCPAHTDVPSYIRMIAQGQFSDAYMENRKSNVFPGILGRVCDRPCEPACRRGRVEDKPVAICRLKRVAADHRDDITERLPKAPEKTNGKKVALLGAGCASLTVANDLAPMGYEVTIFEALDTTGGLMRTNIPSFRLPPAVLDEEIGYILDMGVDLKLGHRIDSMKDLLDEGFDAVFVGTGAPKGKNLEIPGRYDSDRIHIGIEWLESVAFRTHQGDREKSADHWCWQHGDGLLSHFAPAGRRRRQGDGAQATWVLQGIGVGTRRCRGRECRDPGQPLTKRIRLRGRQACRHEV